jgi:YVTN family beta-propeller protein
MKNKIWKLIGLLTIMVFVLSAVNSVHAQTTISDGIGVYPSGIAYNPSTNQVYAVNPYAGTISVIQDSTNEVIQTITGLSATPHDLAYDSGTKAMYISTDDGVDVVPDKSNNVTATIPVANGCVGIAYASGQNEIYVSYEYSTKVAVISDSSNTIVKNITMPEYPGSMTYDKTQNEIFVSEGNPYTGNVAVITASHEIHTTISVGGVGSGPGSVVYDSVKNSIYVTNSTTVSIISDSNNKISKVISNVGAAGSLVYDKTDGKIFCSNGQVISDSTNSVVATLTVGTSPAGIAYDSDTGSIYVTNGNDPGTVTVNLVSSGTPSTENPTSSALSSSTSTPTPAVPEFSSAALIAVAAAMIALTVSAVTLKSRTRKTLQK